MEAPTLSELPASKSRRTGWPWTEGCTPLPDRMEDGREWPRISIVTPSYNQARYIEETTRSVLLQRYPNLEYFVVDGGSTDGSVEVIRRYERWITWWVSERDRGQSHAINKGFARATGEVFAWLNSDDYYLPGALEAVARAWATGDGPAVYVGRGMAVDDEGRTLQTSTPRALELDSIVQWGEHCLFQPACFFPRSAYRDAGGLDEGLHYAMDMDLWLKLLKVVPFRHVQGVVSAAHRHPEMKIWAEGKGFFMEVFDVQVRHGGLEAARTAVERLYDRFEHADSERWRLVRKLRPVVENPFYRHIAGPLLRVLTRAAERRANRKTERRMKRS